MPDQVLVEALTLTENLKRAQAIPVLGGTTIKAAHYNFHVKIL